MNVILLTKSPFLGLFRSGKHSTSNAFTHGGDLNYLYDNVSEFTDILKCKTANGEYIPKPVLIVISDGGPDENPRYRNVIDVAIHHFATKDLDAIFVATNAPGRSAYNRVERRMAPLSKDLCGLVLPHDFYGNHLNNRNETIDVELEKKNFRKAGETLASIWSENVIDHHPVKAIFVEENHSEFEENLERKDQAWVDRHVTFGQYLLQICKCGDNNCCKPKRSSVFEILPEGKLPGPLPISNESSLFTVSSIQCSKIKIDQFAPLLVRVLVKLSNDEKRIFDRFCPSVQSKLEPRTCKDCGKYFSTLQFLTAHKKLHSKSFGRNQKKAEPEQIQLRIRPKRLAAIRASEALAIIAYDENEEDAEWHELAELDSDGIEIPNENGAENAFVMNIERTLRIPWAEH